MAGTSTLSMTEQTKVKFSDIVRKFWPIVFSILVLAMTWGGLLWRMGSLENRVEKIEINHLPHIQDSLNEIAQRLSNIEGRLTK